MDDNQTALVFGFCLVIGIVVTLGAVDLLVRRVRKRRESAQNEAQRRRDRRRLPRSRTGPRDGASG